MESQDFINDVYEVSIGNDPKEDFRFTVGRNHRVKDGVITITEIVYDQNAFHSFGIRRCEIWAKKESGEEFLWKVSENQPLMITSKV
jgi:hypothetical protein